MPKDSGKRKTIRRNRRQHRRLEDRKPHKMKKFSGYQKNDALVCGRGAFEVCGERGEACRVVRTAFEGVSVWCEMCVCEVYVRVCV